MFPGWRTALVFGIATITVVGGMAMSQLPMLGANGLLHPGRRHVDRPVPPTCEETTFAGVGVELRGWRCRASSARRGTIVYLHGVADNRTSAAGVIERFGRRGFDVVAYDSRAHGESGGDICTYGFYEAQDLSRVVDMLEPGPVILLGTSLGAAVALQEAAKDPRIAAVVAAEVFSDLRTVGTERAPFFMLSGFITRAFEMAEAQGNFQVDRVSPVLAAREITAPVLLIHGDADTETPPEHSKRVFAELKGPKRLILVPGAPHNGSLRYEVWEQVEGWIDGVLTKG